MPIGHQLPSIRINALPGVAEAGALGLAAEHLEPAATPDVGRPLAQQRPIAQPFQVLGAALQIGYVPTDGFVLQEALLLQHARLGQLLVAKVVQMGTLLTDSYDQIGSRYRRVCQLCVNDVQFNHDIR